MAFLLDAETVLAGIEQWLQLEKKWGSPVDLDEGTQEDLDYTPRIKTAFSSLDLKKSTFDSSFVFKTSERKLGKYSKKSEEYLEFMEDLEIPKRVKPFFFVSGEILSASSVEEICEDIDDVFKSLEKLCSATSTVRFQAKKRPGIHDIVQCSISAADLSFDDTVEPSQDVDRYIDEVFGHLHSTLASLGRTLDDTSKETVTNLVKKFTTILKSPKMTSSPGLRRQCGEKFRDLAAFWKGQAVTGN